MLEQGRQGRLAVWIDNVEVEADGREGGRDRVGQAGEVDHGAREHHEVRRVHALRRLHQGHAGDLEGLVLSRDPRLAGELSRCSQSPERTHDAKPAKAAEEGRAPLLQVSGVTLQYKTEQASGHRHLSRQLRRLPGRSLRPARPLGLRQVDAAQGRRRLHDADRGRDAPQGRADTRARPRPHDGVPGVRPAAALEDGASRT